MSRSQYQVYLVHMNIPALQIEVLVKLYRAVAVHQLAGVNKASQLTGHYGGVLTGKYFIV